MSEPVQLDIFGNAVPAFDPHTRYRPGDPVTSRDAAESLDSWRIRASQEAVLRVLRAHGPMTQPQLVATYTRTGTLPLQSESGIRSRCAELVEAGLVHDTGRKEQLPSRRWSIVWSASDES